MAKKTITLDGGVKVTIEPMRVKHFAAVMKELEPLLDDLSQISQRLKGVPEEELDAVYGAEVMRLIASNTDVLVNVLSAAEIAEKESLEQLTLDKFAEVAIAFVQVNMDFFTKKVLPKVQRLTNLAEG